MSPATPTLAVERLALHVPSMSEEEARRLAQLVAQSLRTWPSTPTVPARLASVTVRVEQGGRQDDTATLADRIAEAVLAEALRGAG